MKMSARLVDQPYDHIRIIVPGEPKGFVVATGRGKWSKQLKDYRDWRDRCVQEFENAGISCPLFADRAYPVFFHTRAFYSSNRHCDPQNTSKGLIDAVFYGTNGPGDKYVGGSWDAPLYDEENPRVEVELRGWILRKYPNLIVD